MDTSNVIEENDYTRNYARLAAKPYRSAEAERLNAVMAKHLPTAATYRECCAPAVPCCGCRQWCSVRRSVASPALFSALCLASQQQ